MNLWQEYKRPTSITEAIHDLTSASGPVMPIAGGTDLLLDLKQGRHAPVHTLIDLMFVREMATLELKGNQLYVGAAVPVNRVALDTLICTHAQALVEACNLIAGPQVRNVATLGGNVAHALPAADGTIALLALDAEAEIAGLSGSRRVPLNDLFLGPGKSALKHGEELLVGFYLPLSKKGQASCFKRIMRPQGVALPILNCAVWLVCENEAIADIRIAVGPGGATPFRATVAEASLRGQPPTDESFARALKALLAQVKFRTSPRRASAEYRQYLMEGLFKDMLETAWSRAK
jgi:CO/xanthine dehydrogenase FAD-binding subunit